MGKCGEVSVRTRQNIMDAFWELYCEKRIEKITVREVMVRAGYNRGTFYEYFSDVYDVLDQIEQSLLPDLSEIPPLLPELQGEVLPIDSFVKLYSTGSKYYTVLLGDNGDPAFAGKIKNGIKAMLMKQLTQEQKNGERLGTEGINQLEIDYSLEFMLSAMIGILTYWFQNEENMEKEELIRLMYQLMRSEGIMRLAAIIKR